MKNTKQVMYEGKMVPARAIKIGKNKTKLVPISTNRYILYGIPTPKNTEVTKEIQLMAEKIINNSKNNTTENDKALLLKYVRKGQDGFILQNREISSDEVEYFIGRGEPYGVIAAFLNYGELNIGWSKRLTGDVLNLGKIKQREPLIFTKRDAIYIAVLRGLVDSITFRGSGAYTKISDPIPKTITNILWPFIERAQRYFKQNANNVIT